MTTRVMAPPTTVSKNSVYSVRQPSGYQTHGGGVVDMDDEDALIAVTDGWILISGSGTTANRSLWLNGPFAQAWMSSKLNPLNAAVPFAWPLLYFDTSLSQIVLYDSATSTWRDPATGNSV